MLQTINISLPKKLADQVNWLVKEEGYASKSELFRTLLRWYLAAKTDQKPFFLPFQKKPLGEIKKKLKKTGKYSDRFINSVISGLKKSSVY